MKQVAVFNENINALSRGALIAEPGSVASFPLNEVAITCGLLNCRDTRFDPDAPENAEKVLIKKSAFSCNFRDKSLAAIANAKITQFAQRQRPSFYTLGSEFSGEVVAVGRAVKHLAVGDRVIGNGNYPFPDHEGEAPGLPTNHGSKELEPFHFAKLIKVPTEIPLAEAAALPVACQTVYSMVRRLQLKPGEKVLVTAATSNTSLVAISALQKYNVEVYALTTRDQFTEKLKALGCKRVFVVPRGQRSILQQSDILDFVQEHGLFNAVIDPFFDLYLGRVVPAMDIGGRYITCGLFQQVGIDTRLEGQQVEQASLLHIMNTVMSRNIQIIGNCIGNTQDLQNALNDYAKGILKVPIDRIYQREEVAAFFDRSFNSRERFGKVIYQY